MFTLLGRKMSKSLGNSPDPIELMKEFGADGVRVGMLLTSPAGNDLPFDPKLCEQGRNFSNKIWNAFRLINSWEIEDKEPTESAKMGSLWFDSKFNQVLAELNTAYDQYRISEALMLSYKLIWDDFCSWYLEMIKPTYGDSIDRTTYDLAVTNFESILRVIHPFMPFISEELWHHLRERKSPQEAIVVAQWPTASSPNEGLLKSFEKASDVVSNVRTIRKNNNLPNKVEVDLFAKINKDEDKSYDSVVKHLCNVNSITYCDEQVENSFSFIVAGNEYFIPFGDNVDVEGEKDKLTKELEYTKGFCASVAKKLSNERFVSGAPDQVVASERKKMADAEEKIKMIEEKLTSLS
jgi:valyl-tRNA synthetase